MTHHEENPSILLLACDGRYLYLVTLISIFSNKTCEGEEVPKLLALLVQPRSRADRNIQPLRELLTAPHHPRQGLFRSHIGRESASPTPAVATVALKVAYNAPVHPVPPALLLNSGGVGLAWGSKAVEMALLAVLGKQSASTTPRTTVDETQLARELAVPRTLHRRGPIRPDRLQQTLPHRATLGKAPLESGTSGRLSPSVPEQACASSHEAAGAVPPVAWSRGGCSAEPCAEVGGGHERELGEVRHLGGIAAQRRCYKPQ